MSQPVGIKCPRKRILTAGPLNTHWEEKYVLDAIRTGVDERWDEYLKRFESRLSQLLNVRHVLLTSSCSGAMHIAVMALGLGPGDEVIVPEITWVASADVVTLVGATPVFADVDPDTWCIDPKSVESLITARTRCIIPVHVYGHPSPMSEIVRIAEEHGLRVMEDAAPGIGATCGDQSVGTFGDFGAFSFQGAKTVAIGQGGALVTDDEELFHAALTVSDHGCPPGDRKFWIERLGVNYPMSNIQAAVGLGQLQHLDALLAAKRRIFGWYKKGLEKAKRLKLIDSGSWGQSAYAMTCVILAEDSPVTRDELMAALDERNIDTRPAFPAISQYPIWGRTVTPQPNALAIDQRGMNLPSGVRLARTQVDYICQCLRDILT